MTSSTSTRTNTYASASHPSRAQVACTAGLAFALLAGSAAVLPRIAWADDAPESMGGAESQGGGQPGNLGETPNGGGMGGSGADTQSFDYSGTYSGTVSADGTEATVDGESVNASESQVNAVLAQNGGIVSLMNASLTKSGDASDDDACNFYGVNSIVLAVGEDSLMTPPARSS